MRDMMSERENLHGIGVKNDILNGQLYRGQSKY